LGQIRGHHSILDLSDVPFIVSRRRNRHEPRVVKDWRDDYPKMTLPRARSRALLDDWRGKVK
jgi:hypothetical protein